MLDKWKRKTETRTCSWFAFHFYLTTMLLDDGFHDCKPQSIAFDIVMSIIPDAIKAFKDMRQIGGRDAVTGVLHLDGHEIIRFLKQQVDCASIRCVLDRITD